MSKFKNTIFYAGSEHLTASWKVGEGICAHIDVREEEKENAFSLGKNLWIGNEVLLIEHRKMTKK